MCHQPLSVKSWFVLGGGVLESYRIYPVLHQRIRIECVGVIRQDERNGNLTYCHCKTTYRRRLGSGLFQSRNDDLSSSVGIDQGQTRSVKGSVNKGVVSQRTSTDWVNDFRGIPDMVAISG